MEMHSGAKTGSRKNNHHLKNKVPYHSDGDVIQTEARQCDKYNIWYHFKISNRNLVKISAEMQHAIRKHLQNNFTFLGAATRPSVKVVKSESLQQKVTPIKP